MGESRGAAAVTEDDVRALAGLAGLPLGPGRAAALAATLEADLRAIRSLRDVDVGEVHPVGMLSQYMVQPQITSS